MQKSRGGKLWYAKQRSTWKNRGKNLQWGEESPCWVLRGSAYFHFQLKIARSCLQHTSWSPSDIKMRLRRSKKLKVAMEQWTVDTQGLCVYELMTDTKLFLVTEDPCFQCSEKAWDIHVKSSCFHRCRESCQNIEQKLSQLLHMEGSQIKGTTD